MSLNKIQLHAIVPSDFPSNIHALIVRILQPCNTLAYLQNSYTDISIFTTWMTVFQANWKAECYKM